MAQPEPELRQRVVESFGPLASRVLRRDVGAVSEETKLRDDLGMVSASTLELVREMEQTLRIEVVMEGLDEANVDSIGTLADFVVAHSQPAG